MSAKNNRRLQKPTIDFSLSLANLTSLDFSLSTKNPLYFLPPAFSTFISLSIIISHTSASFFSGAPLLARAKEKLPESWPEEKFTRNIGGYLWPPWNACFSLEMQRRKWLYDSSSHLPNPYHHLRPTCISSNEHPSQKNGVTGFRAYKA